MIWVLRLKSGVRKVECCIDSCGSSIVCSILELGLVGDNRITMPGTVKWGWHLPCPWLVT